MKHFYILVTAMLIIFTTITAFAQEIEIELKGLYLASEPKQIQSPWGVLENKMLLLNNPQKVSMDGNNLSILFGLMYFDKKSATTFDGQLKITDSWTAKTKMKVTMFYDKKTENWCVTQGFVAIENSEMVAFNGLEINIVGGEEKPLVVDGRQFSDLKIEIKNNDVYGID